MSCPPQRVRKLFQPLSELELRAKKLGLRMRFEVSRGGREPLYVQIARQVRTGIATGKLAPGDRLPTHRLLGRVLGVNRATVQRSYAELERVGLVTSEGSRGTHVAEGITPAASPRHARKRLSTLVDSLVAEAVRGGLTIGDLFEEIEWSAGRHGLPRGTAKPERRPPGEAGDNMT